MPEQIVLDPAEVATARTAVDISELVGKDGIDWGEAAVEQYLAEAARGQLPIDHRVPNRQIQIPLVLKTVGALSFASARSKVQSKAALFQREGGWLKRMLSDGTALYVDVVGATLKLSGGWFQAHRGGDVEAVLTLEALPDFYGDEIALPDHVETTAAEIVFVENAIAGDYPGRLRLVVDNDDATNAQLGLIWGLRSRHYSAASTARLVYEAEALTPLDSAASVALTGASGGNAVRHNNLSTGWTPVLATNLLAGEYLTHTGAYRVKARLYSTSGAGAVQARFVWDVGDLTHPVENAPWEIPLASYFYVADLGQIRLDEVAAGAHRWLGHLQARGDVGGENIYIDRLWLVPVDESAGELVAPLSLSPTLTGFSTYSARDEFNQAAGLLAGKVLPVGGTWAGAGDADDFSVEATGKTAQRTALGDLFNADGWKNGRFAIAGTTVFTSIAVGVDFKQSVLNGEGYRSAFARYVDTNNVVAAAIDPSGLGTSLHVQKFVAGTRATLWSNPLKTAVAIGGWYTLKLVVDSGGRWVVLFGPQGLAQVVAFGQHADLATGGPLANGRIGVVDYEFGSLTANTRNYDNFHAWVPVEDAVLFGGQSAELRTEGMFREDSSGAAYGPISHVTGDLPRIPPSGLEGRSVECFLKASRGDLDQWPDTGIDDISARAYYRPSWLTAPGT